MEQTRKLSCRQSNVCCYRTQWPPSHRWVKISCGNWLRTGSGNLHIYGKKVFGQLPHEIVSLSASEYANSRTEPFTFISWRAGPGFHSKCARAWGLSVGPAEGWKGRYYILLLAGAHHHQSLNLQPVPLNRRCFRGASAVFHKHNKCEKTFR